jgi:hypothetical protein
MSQFPDQPGETMTREQALAVLSRVGMRGERAEKVLAGLEFPVSKSDIYRHLIPHGLHREALISALGGSP